MFSRLARTVGAAVLALALATSPLPALASTTDTDGDGLLDVWETQGYDADGDGVIDVDFPAMGADPHRKDIFVEMDWMPGLLASDDELRTIVSTFANYPVQNPDGTTGITLHLDAGSARASEFNLGGGNEIEYNPLPRGIRDVVDLRRANSDPARSKVFHYMIWGDKYGTNSSSGVAWVNGREFVVTVGPTHWKQTSSAVRIGTFIHEFGHNLGLIHGGTDAVNFKPNYLSIMNYRYQLTGVPRADGSRHFGYSIRPQPTLDENALLETRGLGPSGRGWMMTLPINGRLTTVRADRPIDFNGDGVISPTPVSVSINGDAKLEQLRGGNDLWSIRFQVAAGAAGLERAPREVAENELTAETAARLGLLPSHG
ncbi:C4-dicarboxylate ABC transporter substrate-binding protein [Falsarthrobacter nasiphocae]|uniref:M6 family metalloprotease domain-containing protein n=1 Tax=Falsarthrobacter nasiphocae TaxID=189863 RepID=A0AAE4C4N0_9MICC|nr:C4-dicarboxylate ABC transporter substrate-binding protein [Falsarthrobacter nasiphocae]MDR6891516.1 hypothetical protein [Falsarthrobacter nasiphocae]